MNENEQVRMIMVRNPFDRRDRDIRPIDFIPDRSLADYVAVEMKARDPGTELVISVNGYIVPEERLAETVIYAGDNIVICPLVVGSGENGGKDFLKILAGLALMFVTMGIGSLAMGGAFAGAAAIAPAAWGIGGWMAYSVASWAGGRLMSAWFPPPTAENQKPSWSSLVPQEGEGTIVGETFGTVRTGGVVLARQITVEGEKQYYNYLASGGNGPLTSISSIKIGDNPIENYTESTAETRLGTNDQTIIENFNDLFYHTPLAYVLDTGVWRTQPTVGTGIQALEILIECPQGLYYTLAGSVGFTSIKISADYRVIGDPDWISWLDEILITEASPRPKRYTYHLNDLVLGQHYEVRVKCAWREGFGPRHVNYATWSLLTETTYDDFSRPGKALVGIKALATDQLQGYLPPITWIQTQNIVQVWDPDTEEYVEKPAYNPAWAAYHILHRCRKLMNINTSEYEYVVEGISAARIIYQEFADWADFCTAKDLRFDYYYAGEFSLWDALKLPEGVGRGKVLIRCTRYGCLWDGPMDSCGKITVGNALLDSFSVRYLSTRDRANAIEITFQDENLDYKTRTILVPGEDWDDAAVMANPTRIDLPGETRFSQAWAQGKYRLWQNSLIKIVSVDIDVDAIHYQVGEVVDIQHDVAQWGEGGRIVSATADTVTIDKLVTLLPPGHSYKIQIRMQDDTWLERSIQAVGEETETDVLTVTASFVPDTEAAAYVDGTHFDVDGDRTAIYTTGATIILIDADREDIVVVIASAYNAGPDTTTVEIALALVQENLENVRYAYTMPNRFDVYAFMEIGHEIEPYRVLSISRTSDQQCSITALEYHEYTEDTNVPSTEDPDESDKIRCLRVQEWQDPQGRLWLYVAWTPPRRNYGGARILVDGKQIAVLGPVTTVYSIPIESLVAVVITVVAVNLDGDDIDSIDTEYRATGDTTPPAAPTDLAIATMSEMATHKTVSMRWTPPEDFDVASYQIWRRAGNYPNDPTGATQIGAVTATNYTDTTGVAGSRYTWYVKAVDTSKNVSEFSVGASAIVPYNHINIKPDYSEYFYWGSLTEALLCLYYHLDD